MREEAYLTTHMTSADLERRAGTPALGGHEFAQGVKFRFFKSMEFPGSATCVNTGQANVEEHVELGLEQPDVNGVIGTHG